MNNEVVKGILYEKESQKSKMKGDSLYIIEKIIRKNKDRYFVKWRNHSNNFNTWVNKNDIVKYA